MLSPAQTLESAAEALARAAASLSIALECAYVGAELTEAFPPASSARFDAFEAELALTTER